MGTGPSSRTALLVVSVAEHGIRRAKEPSGLGKTLCILSCLNGLIRLNISDVSLFVGCYKTFRKCTCMLDNIINLKKIFSKMLDYFCNF